MKNSLRLKQILLFFLVLVFTHASIYADTTFYKPKSNIYINDYVGILNNQAHETITAIGSELESKTGAQAIVVVIPSTEGIPIEDYANKLFRSFGIGQAENDNGLLLLIAINDRAWRVEVGRGLEGAIPDLLSHEIMEQVATPYFSEGNYSAGISYAYSALAQYIAKEYQTTLTSNLSQDLPSPSPPQKSTGKLAAGVIAVILLLDLLFNRGRIFYFIAQILFWSNLSGRNGRGGSSGGNGGFGGGSSNGGGSSGNW